MEFTNIDRMELRGFNSYVIKVIIPAMSEDAADKGNGLNDRDDNAVVGSTMMTVTQLTTMTRSTRATKGTGSWGGVDSPLLARRRWRYKRQ